MAQIPFFPPLHQLAVVAEEATQATPQTMADRGAAGRGLQQVVLAQPIKDLLVVLHRLVIGRVVVVVLVLSEVLDHRERLETGAQGYRLASQAHLLVEPEAVLAGMQML